jgi:putative membrane protein
MLWARWICESVNQLLPVMQVGGNIARAQMLTRRGMEAAEAGASVVVSVSLLFFTQVIFTVAGLVVLVTLLGGGDTAVTAMLGAVLMALAAVGFYVAQHRGMFGGLTRVLGKVVQGHDLITLTGSAEMLDAAVARHYRDRGALVGAGAWHLLAWIAGTGEVWLALYLLGHPVGLAEAFLLESLGQAVRAAGFMVPGALGIQEGGYLALGRLVGVPPDVALALSLSKRARELLLGIPGLVSWQIDTLRPTSSQPSTDRVAATDHRPNPILVRAVNDAGRPFAARIRLDSDELIDVAARRTGLTDQGDDGFREPLRRLVASWEDEAMLSPIGRVAARRDALRLLANRLRMREDRRRHPEIATEKIRQPLFVTGLPRTGTTILHGLLSQDSASRAPRGWDTMYPSPPPAGEALDWRVAKSGFQIGWLERLAPGFQAIHPLGALIPQECLVITSHSFMSYQFQTSHHVPSYQSWLQSQDLDPAYRAHREFLQHLQWRRSTGHWVLKAPAHLYGIEAIFAAYPDAGVILTHRHPLEVTPSLASLTVMLRRAFSEHVDPKATAREMSERWAQGMTRALAVRDSGRVPANRFADVDYREFLDDPLGVVRRIYDHFGLELRDDAERRMRRYLAANPKNKHGRHRYSLEAFGLDRDEELARYGTYCQRFGL